MRRNGEARLIHLQTHKPAEHQIVIEPSHNIRALRSSHQQRSSEHPGGIDGRPHRAVHLVEQRRQFRQRRLGHLLDPSEQVLFRQPGRRAQRGGCVFGPLEGNQSDMDRFFGAFVGTVPVYDFYAPASIGRSIARNL
jgi:hypothetical protein